ncbi:uncharacterized protein PHA67_002224 [Liasis olivaceus]
MSFQLLEHRSIKKRARRDSEDRLFRHLQELFHVKELLRLDPPPSPPTRETEGGVPPPAGIKTVSSALVPPSHTALLRDPRLNHVPGRLWCWQKRPRPRLSVLSEADPISLLQPPTAPPRAWSLAAAAAPTGRSRKAASQQGRHRRARLRRGRALNHAPAAGEEQPPSAGLSALRSLAGNPPAGDP